MIALKERRNSPIKINLFHQNDITAIANMTITNIRKRGVIKLVFFFNLTHQLLANQTSIITGSIMGLLLVLSYIILERSSFIAVFMTLQS